MKILVLGDLPPYVLGGAERQLLLLSEAWHDAGHDILVLGHRTPTGLHNGIRARRVGVVYRCGRLLRGITFSLSLGWHLWRERRNFDVIYCRFLGEAAIVAVTAKAIGLLSLPLVVAPAAAGEGTNSDVSRLRSMRAWPLLRWWLRKGVQAFNAISPAIHEELDETGLGPVTAIPNGVRMPASPRPHVPPGPSERFWMFCGRIAPQKGLDMLLNALARTGRSDIRLMVVGEGPDEEALRAYCQRLGLLDRVSFTGRLSHSETLETMTRAYALVLPSRYEGLSNAALEALASGLPVLSTRCGGIDEYLQGGTGWVCDADPHSLADALSVSADAPAEQWQEMSVASRVLATKSFAIDMCATEHLRLFSDVITQDAAAGSRR